MVNITKNINDKLISYRQLKTSDLEGCGLLIGTHSHDEKLLCVKKITEPKKKDIRKRSFFKIKSRYHKQQLEQAFRDSGCKEVYLGTWHTHPEDTPSPSSVDIRDWKKQYKENQHLFCKMIFIIIGKKNTLCWSIEKGKKIKLDEIKII